MKQHIYLHRSRTEIFYASVECRERGLDPLDTNFVADKSRTDMIVCLYLCDAYKKVPV